MTLQSCGLCFARPLALVAAAAVVRLDALFAIELGLLEPLVDNVMYKAPPHGRRLARRHLRGVLVEHLSKVGGALAAAGWVSRASTQLHGHAVLCIPGVQSLEQVYVGSERLLLIRRGLLGEASKRRVEDLPCGTT
jgi:hypothetical protein